jgi:replication factor C large subunit
MLWIDENMPYEFKDKGDLIRGYEKLARADVFMGRVGRRQYYRFWAYAGDMMSSGVNISRRSETGSYERFRFPMYLAKMSVSGVRIIGGRQMNAFSKHRWKNNAE